MLGDLETSPRTSGSSVLMDLKNYTIKQEDGTLMNYPGARLFSGWTLLSGATSSSPTLTASQTSNSLHMIVRGNDNRKYVNTWNGSTWQGWTVLPSGITMDSPAATIVENTLCIFVRGSDGSSLGQSSIDLGTSTFSDWKLLSGSTPSAPTLTS